jgi:hypothetical protein
VKVIIAGSRDINDVQLVERAIQESGFVITEVVCGMARGVDTIGRLWAERNKIHVAHFPADWNRFGKRAGHLRNAEMADYAEALICIHHDSPGSLDMVQLARARGLKIYEVRVNPTPR